MSSLDSIVIDCDSHVMEPPDLWEKYLEPKFRDRAIRIAITSVGIEMTRVFLAYDLLHPISCTRMESV